MRTYVDIYFSADGATPLRVAEVLHKELGMSFVFGPHDLVFHWKELPELYATIEKLNRALEPLGVYLRFLSEEETRGEPDAPEFHWPPLPPTERPSGKGTGPEH